MFIRTTSIGNQVVSGDFLILLSPDESPFAVENVRAVVRYVRLLDCGVTMVGVAKFRDGFRKHNMTISWREGSTFANDTPAWVWEMGVPIPESVVLGGRIDILYLREWARETFPPTPAYLRGGGNVR